MSQDAAGRDVENFRRQPVDLRRYYVGDAVFRPACHGTQVFTEVVCLVGCSYVKPTGCEVWRRNA